jgi:hypothetical protein
LEGSSCDLIKLLAQRSPAGIQYRITRTISQDIRCPVRDTNGEFPEEASRACYVIAFGLYVITRLSGPRLWRYNAQREVEVGVDSFPAVFTRREEETVARGVRNTGSNDKRRTPWRRNLHRPADAFQLRDAVVFH